MDMRRLLAGFRLALQALKVSDILHITHDISVNMYKKKQVTFKGNYLSAYIHTGSRLNVFTITQAKVLRIPIQPILSL